ncbi:MAG TPA: hypothetical protein PLK06_04105, partial [bacterium]|nr:hypothetical protein [bacterium]
MPSTQGGNMYYERFDAHECRVIYVDGAGRFAIAIKRTPNGTDTPDEQAFIVNFDDGTVARTAIEVDNAPLNEHAHFTGPKTDRAPKKGDLLLYRAVITRSWRGDRIPELVAWCYADEFHDLRSRMPELRYLAPNGRRHFHHLLDLMRQITEEGIEIPSNVTW